MVDGLLLAKLTQVRHSRNKMCGLARHWPLQKRLSVDYEQRGRSNAGCSIMSCNKSITNLKHWHTDSPPLSGYVNRCCTQLDWTSRCKLVGRCSNTSACTGEYGQAEILLSSCLWLPFNVGGKNHIIGRLATTQPGWEAGKLKSATWSTHSQDIRSAIFVTAVFEHA